MALRETLVALVDAFVAEQKTEGTVEAASVLDAVTTACEDRARAGFRSVAFPEPTDKAEFLTKGAAYKIQELLLAEGLGPVNVIPYKDVFFYLDIHW
jgi:hypothetical protein